MLAGELGETDESVLQNWLGPGFAFVYQKAKSATGPPSLTTVFASIVPA
jgi:hypothetical protein